MDPPLVQFEGLHLLELPYLVFEGILKYMTPMDLYRLRLTSSAMRAAVSAAFKRKSYLQIEIVQGTNLTFGHALEFAENVGSIKSLYINNQSDQVYNDPNLDEFLAKHGSQIEELKISKYFLESPRQLHFLVGLNSVKAFKIEVIDARNHKKNYTLASPRPYVLPIPPFFQDLKVLKFWIVQISSVFHTDFWLAMIAACGKLNYLRYPHVQCEVIHWGPGRDHSTKYECIKSIIRKQSNLPTEHRLAVVDFKNLVNPEDIEGEWLDFWTFVVFIMDKGIKISKLHCDYLQKLTTTPLGDQMRCFDECITSLVDYEPGAANFPGSHLKKIRINSMPWSTLGPYTVPQGPWENLESIRIDFVMHLFCPKGPNLQRLVGFLFLPNHRHKVRELKLTFDAVIMERETWRRVISAKRIVESFHGLRKLTLIGWNPTNRAFIRLWDGLPLLEELTLQNCPSVGNVAFIGEDVNAPAFLNLKRLKSLTLGLDKMSKVTDLCFKSVFRHMKLKEFQMLSSMPLPNVSKGAISSLLDGEFANTVERFPFDSWSSIHISSEEMKELRAQFKSLIF